MNRPYPDFGSYKRDNKLRVYADKSKNKEIIGWSNIIIDTHTPLSA